MTYLFAESTQKLPIPRLPFAADGSALTADGVKLFNLEQAARHFACTADGLKELYEQTFGDVQPSESPALPEETAHGGAVPEVAAIISAMQTRAEIFRRIHYPQIAHALFMEFVQFCVEKGFSPFWRQAYPAVEDDRDGNPRLNIIVGIEAIRLIAHRTDRYVGNKTTTFEYGPDGKLVSATAYAYKIVDGEKHLFDAKVYWEEYCPPNSAEDDLWRRMPRVCLDRCAEAAVLRRTFPHEMGNIYVREEMDQAKRRRKKEAGAAEDEPQTLRQLELEMIGMGLKDRSKRMTIVSDFRKAYAHLDDSPEFFAIIYRALKSNPEAYSASSAEMSFA